MFHSSFKVMAIKYLLKKSTLQKYSEALDNYECHLTFISFVLICTLSLMKPFSLSTFKHVLKLELVTQGS